MQHFKSYILDAASAITRAPPPPCSVRIVLQNYAHIKHMLEHWA